jgi:hypothetical protein
MKRARKLPRRNTAVKKQSGQGEMDSDYLFADLELPGTCQLTQAKSIREIIDAIKDLISPV